MSELIEELKRYAETAPGCMINGNRLAPLLRRTVAKLEAVERRLAEIEAINERLMLQRPTAASIHAKLHEPMP